MNKHKKILLVEDYSVTAATTVMLLERNGYETKTSGSGEMAIEIIKNEPDIDLILMDIELGKGMDGCETAQETLKIRNIPIVFFTSHSEKEFVDKVRNITRYGYVLKDSGEFVLISSIEMAFELFDAHERTRKSEELYRLLTENSNDIIWKHTLDGIFTYHSPSVFKLLGYTPEEANEIPLEKMITSEHLALVKKMFKDEEEKPIASQWENKSIELEVYRKDGTTFWAEATINCVRDAEGNITGLQGSTRDITKRKKTEKALHEVLCKYQILFETFPHAITLTNEDGKIIETNKVAEKLLGISNEEILKRKINSREWKIIRTDGSIMPPEEFASIRALFEKKAIENVEMGIVKPDDEITWLNVTASPLDIEGYGVIITYNDITEKKKTEARLKESLGEKQMLIKEIHHRVKNNMQTISSLLMLQSEYISDSKLKAVFNESRDRIRSMALVHEMLYQSDQTGEINFRNFLSTILPVIFHSWGKIGVTYQIEADEIFLKVNTAISCALIVNELVTNSLKYAFPDNREGEVRVEMKSEKKGEVKLIIRDNGIGLKKENPEASTSMGMTIVYALTKQIKGEITVASEEGTSFTIVF